MNFKHIYKICTCAEWSQAKKNGKFTGSKKDILDGFIHLSNKNQLSGTFKKYYLNQKDLICNNLPNEYLKSSNKNIREIIELISGEKFNDMGQVFLNLSFKKDGTISKI